MLKTFEEYLREGVTRKKSPDILRAENLIKESKNRQSFLTRITNNIKLKETDANYIIEQVYDSLIELIRAKMFIDGFEATGNSAHESEVAYLKELKFLDEEKNLMNELRIFRDRIKYYGRTYSLEQSNNALEFMKK